MIEERDEEFKATGTQNVAKHLKDWDGGERLAELGANGKGEGEAANAEHQTPAKAGGLYIETRYDPKLPKPQNPTSNYETVYYNW